MNYPMTIDLFTSEEEASRINAIENEIDSELKCGSGRVDGKYRIYQICTSPIDSQAMIKALRIEYGIGGTGTCNSNIFKWTWHDYKGIKYEFGNKDFILLDWPTVLRKIKKLIQNGDYMLGYEIDRYSKIINEPDFYNLGLIKATSKEEEVYEENEE